MTAVEVTIACPPCRDSGSPRRDVYSYARAYLCANHKIMWNAEDQRQHRGGKCPHAPKPCERCAS